MTRRRGPAVVTATFVVLLLAGCTDDAPADEGPVEYVPGDEVPDLFGRVLDGRERPLPLADIRIPDLDLATVSDEEGYFDFGLIDHEGRVLVEASKDGHHPARTDVVMADDLAAQVIFRLPLLDELGPRTFVQEFSGFIACRAHGAGVAEDCPGTLAEGDSRAFTLDLPVPDAESLDAARVLLEWEPTGPGSEALRVHAGPEGTPETVVGVSPLRLDLSPEAVAALADDPVLHVRVDVDAEAAGLTFAQRFDGTVESVTIH